MSDESINLEGEVTEESPIDNTVENLTQAQKDYWLAVYFGLCGSDRFLDFVRNNYDIQNHVDHDKKSLEIRVIEKPVVVGPAINPNQIFKIHGMLSKHGTKEVVECTKSLLRILGQEESPIVLASDIGKSDAPALVLDSTLKSKLD